MRELNSSILLSRLDAYREAEAPCKQVIHRTLRHVVIDEHANSFSSIRKTLHRMPDNLGFRHRTHNLIPSRHGGGIRRVLMSATERMARFIAEARFEEDAGGGNHGGQNRHSRYGGGDGRRRR